MPTTGFDDVKRVALARLVVDNIPSIQVDWALYGPKLAQVALTVGADDVDGVSADRRPDRGPPPRAARRDPPQHPGGRAASRSSGTAASSSTRAMTPVRLGAVGYLNARPLVFGLERSPRFDAALRSCRRAARALLHDGAIDVGLIPSIEYLRGPARRPAQLRIVPDLAIASRGPVASVALYTSRPIADVRSIALDTSSRTSVALVAGALRAGLRHRAATRAARAGSRRDAGARAMRR